MELVGAVRLLYNKLSMKSATAVIFVCVLTENGVTFLVGNDWPIKGSPIKQLTVVNTTG